MVDMLFDASAPMQVQLRHCLSLSSFRGWSLSEWLLAVRGCMHAHDAHITAKLCRNIVLMSVRTLGRRRSSAVSARMLQALLAI
jgi:hypothetical protein